jgi:serine kinase of HPr protein (carbohydrate metabolism regulator)
VTVLTGRATIHASAVLVGARAALIRGPAGSGKSSLIMALIDAAATGLLPFARLVADDRVLIERHHGRLLARAPEALAGLLEVRSLGLRRLPYEPVAALGWVVDLGVEKADRLPQEADLTATLASVTLPRIAVRPCADAAAVLLAALRSRDARVAR